ncbi:hypothetical protein Scep_002300 [Stephania cephalantha]|uniref:TFIIS N-terminal domain-containing protein n=1 Tax=Stephania cephalantha TaxID=152367 RepID=A0AAP0Q5U3_9MAGN
MDFDDLRSILRNSGVDLWTLIDSAISMASADYRAELMNRRDGMVEKLYAPPVISRCKNCDHQQQQQLMMMIDKDQKESSSHELKGGGSPSTPISTDDADADADEDRDGRRFSGNSIDVDDVDDVDDDEQTRILNIKEQLDDLDQSEDSVIHLLQNLKDMDITFKALQETDIGRHVNRFRKHQSNEVRRLVKQLVRKWKDLVDEWVKSNMPGEVAAASALIDEDSPLQNTQKSNQNGHHQVPDFTYSPNNTHNWSSGSDKNTAEPESKGKTVPRRAPPQPKPVQSVTPPNSALPNRQGERKDSTIDPERFASARRRLHENYQEAQNAKKQRTIQVMDIHDIPKPKNTFFARNKGGFQTKHW